MINPLLPGFLTKGRPRLKLLFDYTPALFFLLRLPSLHIPSLSRPHRVPHCTAMREGAGDARPGDKGKQGPWGPAHLGSVISALIGVNSTRPLPFATPNVGKCAMATLCSERGVPCRISALLQPKQRLTLLQLGPCRDCQMPFGDFRDLEKGRRTQCLAFLLLSTLCHPQATVDQCCVPAAGKSMTLPRSLLQSPG